MTHTHLYFWRAYIKDKDATLWVDSAINFFSIEAAEQDWKINGASMVRSRGYGLNQVTKVSVMEHSH